MFERYTEKARCVIFFARYEAAQYGSPYIETEHLLLAIAREAPRVLTDLISSAAAPQLAKWREKLSHLKKEAAGPTTMDIPLSDESKRALRFAAEEVERLNHRHIGPEHLLLGLLREQHGASALLTSVGITLDRTRERTASYDYSAAMMNEPVGLPNSMQTISRLSRGGVIEFTLTPSGDRVGIVGLRALTHLPRPGDLVELPDISLGKRRFRVKEIVHAFQLLEAAPQYRNYELSNIVITVELVEGDRAKPGFEGMT